MNVADNTPNSSQTGPHERGRRTRTTLSPGTRTRDPAVHTTKPPGPPTTHTHRRRVANMPQERCETRRYRRAALDSQTSWNCETPTPRATPTPIRVWIWGLETRGGADFATPERDCLHLWTAPIAPRDYSNPNRVAFRPTQPLGHRLMRLRIPGVSTQHIQHHDRGNSNHGTIAVHHNA